MSSDKEMLAVFCVDWKESTKLHRRSDCLYSIWERDVALTDVFKFSERKGSVNTPGPLSLCPGNHKHHTRHSPSNNSQHLS